jgi:tetratricopeptide (TPR) repeat protein
MPYSLKRTLFHNYFFSAHLTGRSQADSAFLHTKRIDSLKRSLAAATKDSARIFYLQSLNFDYETVNADSSLKYGLAALELSRKSKNFRAEARTLNGLSGVLRQQGRFAEALEYLFEGRKLAERIGFIHEVARSYRRTGIIYSDLRDFSKARDCDMQALMLDQTLADNHSSIMVDCIFLADVYETLNKPDSACIMQTWHYKDGVRNESLIHTIFITLGNIYYGKTCRTVHCFIIIPGCAKHRYSDYHDVAEAANKIAALYHGMPNRDSALRYALMAFQFGQGVSYKKSVMQAAALLADLYDSTDARRSLQYYRISNAAKDSLFGTDNIHVIQTLIDREERRRKEAEDARLAYSNRVRWYGLLSGVLVLLVITWLLYRNNRQKQKPTYS